MPMARYYGFAEVELTDNPEGDDPVSLNPTFSDLEERRSLTDILSGL